MAFSISWIHNSTDCHYTDSPVARFFKNLDAIENPIHPLVFEKIDKWLENCNGTHLDCPRLKDQKALLPTRLLDLSSLPNKADFSKAQGDPRKLMDDKAFRLVENSQGSTGQYITLSYCWGKSLAYTTTTANLQMHKQDGGIKYAQLPKTLQDAVFLVRNLGFQYLWADCLCIIQDDKADWEHEAARMANVYTNAYLTIAATRASHCGEGFLQERKSKDRQMVSFADQEGVYKLHFYYDDLVTSPGSMDSVIDETLSMRKVSRNS